MQPPSYYSPHHAVSQNVAKYHMSENEVAFYQKKIALNKDVFRGLMEDLKTQFESFLEENDIQSKMTRKDLDSKLTDSKCINFLKELHTNLPSQKSEQLSQAGFKTVTTGFIYESHAKAKVIALVVDYINKKNTGITRNTDLASSHLSNTYNIIQDPQVEDGENYGSTGSVAASTDPNSLANNQLTYEQRAGEYLLKTALRKTIQFELKKFLIETMEQEQIVSLSDLKESKLSAALDHLHLIANDNEKALLRRAGFETTSCFNSAKAAAKVKALMTVFFGTSVLKIKNGHQYEILLAMPEPPPEARRAAKVPTLFSLAQAPSSVAPHEVKSDITKCINACCPKTLAWVIAKHGLNKLDLSGCGIRFDHNKLLTLFDALAICPIVTTLNLSTDSTGSNASPNCFDDVSAMSSFCSNCLKENRTLRSINLAGLSLYTSQTVVGSEFNFSMLVRFAEAVNSSGLTSVCFGWGDFMMSDSANFDRVKRIISQNTRITHWEVRSNDFVKSDLNCDDICERNKMQIQ